MARQLSPTLMSLSTWAVATCVASRRIAEYAIKVLQKLTFIMWKQIEKLTEAKNFFDCTAFKYNFLQITNSATEQFKENEISSCAALQTNGEQ